MIGVSSLTAALPNIITVPQPPAALAAWYAISSGDGLPPTARFVPCGVETMRFFAVREPSLTGLNRRSYCTKLGLSPPATKPFDSARQHAGQPCYVPRQIT